MSIRKILFQSLFITIILAGVCISVVAVATAVGQRNRNAILGDGFRNILENPSLGDLSDVDTSLAAADDILIFDGNEWMAEANTGAAGGSSIWSTSTPDVLYYNGARHLVIGASATSSEYGKFQITGGLFVDEATTTGFTINGERITDLTGTNLSIVGGALTAADTNTTYTAGGTLLDLTGTTFSLNEGTLTDTKYCTYEAGTGIQCISEGGSGGGATDYLGQIGDVSTSTLANGYIIKYNTSTEEWEATSTLNTFFYEQATSTDTQTVFDLTTFTYDVGDNELEVFVNGVYQIIGDSYSETDSDTITFNTGLSTGDRVVFAVRGGIVDAGGGSQLTEEQVEDYIGGMVTGNTETNITVTYEDSDGTLDFVVTGGAGGWTFATTTLDYWFDETTGITRLTPYVTQAYASSTYAIAGGAFHDGFSDFVANEHLDWTTDLGATNIHSGNYTDTDTTYTAGGTLLGLTGTTFSLNEGTLTNGKYCTYVTGTGIQCTSEGGASYWTQTGNDIYYDTGNVGIGTSTINSTLVVDDGLTSTTTVQYGDVDSGNNKARMCIWNGENFTITQFPKNSIIPTYSTSTNCNIIE